MHYFIKVLVLFVLLFSSQMSYAQYEHTTNWDERIGHGEDSVRARKVYVEFQNEHINTRNWDLEGYRCWRYLFDKVPFCHKNIVSSGGGCAMLESLMTSEQDPSIRLLFYQDLMEVCDFRIKNLKALNSFEEPKSRVALGDVMVWKAYYYNKYGPDVKGSGYTEEQAHDNYVKAFAVVREKGGTEDLQAAFLSDYYLTSYKLYQKDPDKYFEQFLKDYQECQASCEKMLSLAKKESDPDEAKRINDMYEGARSYIEANFTNSGIASTDNLIAHYTPLLESHKDDIKFLESALDMMTKYNCTAYDIYFEYAKQADELKPSYLSSMGMAAYHNHMANQYQREYDVDMEAQEREKMLQSYKKAELLCTNDSLRGSVCMEIANGLVLTHNYVGAEEYLNKAVKYDKNLAGKAKFYEGMSHTYNALAQYRLFARSQGGNYSAAVAYQNEYQAALNSYQSSKRMDITMTGRADAYEKWTRENVGKYQENIRKVIDAKRRNAAAQAEYERYMAKKRREEEFWRK